MAIPIEQHPNYGTAMAAYQTAKNAATEAGDPTRIAQVDLDWANTRSTMQNEMFDRVEQERKRSEAVAAAKALVPEIPDALLARLTDPADILATAEEMKAQADARQPQGQAPPNTPGTPPAQPNAPSWGAGPPTAATQTPQDPNDPKVFHAHMTDLAKEIETDAGRKPAAVEEFGKEYFKAFILPGMIKPAQR